MSSLPVADAGTLSLFAPPYDLLIPCGVDILRELSDVDHWKGCALVWQLAVGRKDPATVSALAARSPGLPLLVLLPPPSEVGAIVDMLPMVRSLNPRLILPFGVVDAPVRLRQVLALGPRNLPVAVTDHLIRRGVLRHRRGIREFRRIFELAPDTGSIADLSRRMYTSRRTLGRHFFKLGMPVPSHCLHFARLLNVALCLHNEDVAVFRAATRFGYPDGFTMSNQMKRLTGHRPSEVRELLGWEWLVEMWVKREGLE